MYESCYFCCWMIRNCQNATSCFSADSGCKCALLTHCIYIKKGHSVVFFIFSSKCYVHMMRI